MASERYSFSLTTFSPSGRSTGLAYQPFLLGGLYFGLKTIFIPLPKMIFSPSLATRRFCYSYRALVVIILPYSSLILPYDFLFSLFSPFSFFFPLFSFLSGIFPLFHIYLLPQMTSADIFPSSGRTGYFPFIDPDISICVPEMSRRHKTCIKSSRQIVLIRKLGHEQGRT